MLLLERKSVPYLPADQGGRGGPAVLGIVRVEDDPLVIPLPDNSTVSVPVYTFPVPAGEGADVALIWKLRAGTAPVSQSVVYSALASPWRDLGAVIAASGDYWHPYATGRLSVLDPATLHNVFTWNMRPAAGNSYYNARAGGGLMGLLYFKNYAGDEITLPAAFGDRTAALEWAVTARVVGAPLYHYGGPAPTSVSDAEEKTTLRTRRGQVFTSPRSTAPILRFRISAAANPKEWAWHKTLALAQALDSFVCFPAGVNDIYSDDEVPDFLSLGYARRMALTRFTGPQPIRGGYTGSGGVAFSATFEEAVR